MSANNVKNIEETLINIRTRLLFRHPFFGVFLIKTNIQENRYLKFPLAVDGNGVIYYNPTLLQNFSEEDISLGLVHEALHIALCHFLRCKTRDRFIWNLAADYAVNSILYSTFHKIVPGSLFSSSFEGLSAEEIYDILLEGKVSLPQKVVVSLQDGQDGDSRDFDPNSYNGAFDAHKYVDALSQDELENITEKIKETVLQAAEVQKVSKGDIPACLQRIVNQYLKTNIPWHVVLYQYVSLSIDKDEYLYYPPNRRYLAIHDVWKPSLRSERPGNIVVAIDTSASITARTLQEFASGLKELRSIVNDITLITCDCRIHDVVPLSKIDDFLRKFRFRGGGGTSHIPVFDYIKKHLPDLDAFIGFTDLFSDFPSKPLFPVIWVVPEYHGKAPWGKVIVLSRSKDF